MAKFKIGDKVKFNEVVIFGGIECDKIYTVTLVGQDGSHEYINVEGLDSTMFYSKRFSLVEQATTKHYKWLLYFEDEISKKPIIRKTEHYVSPEKIKSYLEHFKLDRCKEYHMIEDQFVED